ncbi:GNAT family N-acetyltransferase [Leptospira langatensis]|uniref:GNAT family N-acetyltransferase n=1 Tax=Leptospira langatensis TaxID=2484983 RepID=A0A5F1ZUF3_9LEPT|nr:GNAT family N-acetyltransferase [Leptospira langatensis]TGK01460.1 GNAT family N-acetyltransferase [Leptospira langatensis]TGL42090.1 GNAT family N-acetyltransferase [Leptospira langatensis]
MQNAPTILTRIATRSDLEELAELFDLYRRFYRFPSDVHAAKRFLEDRLLHKDSILLVAEGSGGLLGFAQLYPTFSSLSIQKDYILNDLYVRESERRSGIARKLLGEAASFVVKCGGKGMGLETHPDNRAARILYEHFGFKLSESFLHYYWTAPKEA